MGLNSINIKWDFLGAELAALSDEEQSEFFKGFARELNSYESNYAKDMQMASVNMKLSEEDKAILREHLPNIWYSGENDGN